MSADLHAQKCRYSGERVSRHAFQVSNLPYERQSPVPSTVTGGTSAIQTPGEYYSIVLYPTELCSELVFVVQHYSGPWVASSPYLWVYGPLFDSQLV